MLPLLNFQKKDLLEILRYSDPKGKLSTYHSIFIQVGIIQSSPPSAPDNSILSHKSLWESLLFVGFNRFNPQRGSKFWGIFTTYKYPKLPIQDQNPRLKSKSFPPAIQLVPLKKKHTGSPGRPCRPFRDVVDGICLRSIGGLWIPWRTDPPFPKKRKNGEEKNTYL